MMRSQIITALSPESTPTCTCRPNVTSRRAMSCSRFDQLQVALVGRDPLVAPLRKRMRRAPPQPQAERVGRRLDDADLAARSRSASPIVSHTSVLISSTHCISSGLNRVAGPDALGREPRVEQAVTSSTAPSSAASTRPSSSSMPTRRPVVVIGSRARHVGVMSESESRLMRVQITRCVQTPASTTRRPCARESSRPPAGTASSTSNVGVCSGVPRRQVAGARRAGTWLPGHVLQVARKVLAAHAGPRHLRHVVAARATRVAASLDQRASIAGVVVDRGGCSSSKSTSSCVPVTFSMPSASRRMWAIVCSRTCRSSVRTVPSSTTCFGNHVGVLRRRESGRRTPPRRPGCRSPGARTDTAC